MAASYELLLPEEMWESVMEFLPPSDLCQLSLSSTYFCSVATSSKLWSRLSIDHVSLVKLMSEGLEALLEVTRFSHLKHLDLSVVRSVDHFLFRLPTVQFNGLFDFIIAANYRGILTLTSLNLKHQNLSDVNQFKLSLAVSYLLSVDLSYTRLSRPQCSDLFSLISSQTHSSCSQTPIQELKLAGIFLSHVFTIHLPSAVNSLKRADMSWSRLTVQQCSSILSYSEPSLLTHLNLEGINLYSEADMVPLEQLSFAGKKTREDKSL